jgi:5-formyltetrahydrofolate cyclo-ligase
VNKLKYRYLYEYIPSLEKIIENKKITGSEKKSLEYIYNYYRGGKNDFSKKEFRKNFIQQREKIDIDELKRRSLKLSQNLISSAEFKNAATVFCYISFNKEIDTYKILRDSLKQGKTLCVPVIRAGSMIAVRIKNLDNLKANSFGILEPVFANEIVKSDIDLAVVPGLAFNLLGYRIGYGKGYYDKFLSDFRGYSISIVLKEFIIDLIPDKFDMPVDKMIF